MTEIDRGRYLGHGMWEKDDYDDYDEDIEERFGLVDIDPNDTCDDIIRKVERKYGSKNIINFDDFPPKPPKPPKPNFLFWGYDSCSSDPNTDNYWFSVGYDGKFPEFPKSEYTNEKNEIRGIKIKINLQAQKYPFFVFGSGEHQEYYKFIQYKEEAFEEMGFPVTDNVISVNKWISCSGEPSKPIAYIIIQGREEFCRVSCQTLFVEQVEPDIIELVKIVAYKHFSDAYVYFNEHCYEYSYEYDEKIIDINAYNKVEYPFDIGKYIFCNVDGSWDRKESIYHFAPTIESDDYYEPYKHSILDVIEYTV